MYSTKKFFNITVGILLFCILVSIKLKFSWFGNIDRLILERIHLLVNNNLATFFEHIIKLADPKISFILGILFATILFFKNKYQSLSILIILIGGNLLNF